MDQPSALVGSQGNSKRKHKKKKNKEKIFQGKTELVLGRNAEYKGIASSNDDNKDQIGNHKSNKNAGSSVDVKIVAPIPSNAYSDADKWNFIAEYNDHFETPLKAYQDISAILNHVARLCGKENQDMKIYDPYYCKGQMVSHLNKLGYLNVINNNRDFYKDIRSKSIPGNIEALAIS